MKTLIVYKSLLGASKQYAEWLKEEINGEVCESKKIDAKKLSKYDTIVIASGISSVQIKLMNFLKKNWNILKNKTVILVASGMRPAKTFQSIRAYLFIPEEIRSKIKYFKLPGKISKFSFEDIRRENILPVVDYLRSLTVPNLNI